MIASATTRERGSTGDMAGTLGIPLVSIFPWRVEDVSPAGVMRGLPRSASGVDGHPHPRPSHSDGRLIPHWDESFQFTLSVHTASMIGRYGHDDGQPRGLGNPSQVVGERLDPSAMGRALRRQLIASDRVVTVPRCSATASRRSPTRADHAGRVPPCGLTPCPHSGVRFIRRGTGEWRRRELCSARSRYRRWRWERPNRGLPHRGTHPRCGRPRHRSPRAATPRRGPRRRGPPRAGPHRHRGRSRRPSRPRTRRTRHRARRCG